jgi:hypothetical protein
VFAPVIPLFSWPVPSAAIILAELGVVTVIALAAVFEIVRSLLPNESTPLVRVKVPVANVLAACKVTTLFPAPPVLFKVTLMGPFAAGHSLFVVV